MSEPAAETKKEIRFAVVMYGGGSLAIYINGIAQELLKMVRATTLGKDDFIQAKSQAQPGDKALTEEIYRKVAHLAADEQLLEDIVEISRAGKAANRAEDDIKRDIKEKIKTGLSVDEKPSVRFIVDVLTGSSAGGINAVFLAKALANDQSIDRLKKLWLSEGDFDKLLNDKQSVADNNLVHSAEPASLLNSQRMYLRLLEALHEMDETTPPKTPSPHVDDLDLFVTVTDFTGVPVPLRHFDRVVFERRHRQAFHFKYGNCGADSPFQKDHNPFLAFAARSTSAFPLAFEPMSLADIDDVIKTDVRLDKEYGEAQGKAPSENNLWRRFFDSFKLPHDVEDDAEKQIAANRARYFVDGGALDNKPFGFAIETLLQRESSVPVDRKLIYIEPSPEFLTEEGDVPQKADALQNLVGQASSLPRYETIREDLQKVLDRNRLIERVNRLINNAEKDFYNLMMDERAQKTLLEQQKQKEDADNLPKANASGLVWEDYGMKEIIAAKGRAFLPYYRLRLIYLTDNIARSITLFFGFNDDSDYFLAIRSLVRVWREQEFVESKKDAADEAKTVNYFMRRYDLSYRLRRIRFTMRKAEQLNLFEQEIRDLLQLRQENEEKIRRRIKNDDNLEAIRQDGYSEKEKITTSEGKERFPSEVIWQKCGKDKIDVEPSEKDKTDEPSEKDKTIEQMRRLVAYCQSELNRIFQDLRRRQEKINTFRITSSQCKNLPSDAPEKSLFEALDSIMRGDAQNIISKDVLNSILGESKIDGKTIKFDFNEEIGLKRATRLLFDQNKQPRLVYENLRKAAEELGNYLEDEIFTNLRIEVTALLNPSGIPKLISELNEKHQEKLEKLDEIAKGKLDERDKETELPETSIESKREKTSRQHKEILEKSKTSQLNKENLKNLDELNKRHQKEFDALDADSELSAAVRGYLWHYYDNFDDYDQISFPIFYETPVGEADLVEVVRISPHDSASLINETKKGELRRKLAGDVLFGFGAFLDVRWRQNDITWGRLDAAERLITAILPTDENYRLLREILVREAHDEILFEEFTCQSRNELNKEMLGVLLHAKSLGDDEKGAKKSVGRLIDNLIESSALEKSFQEVLGNCLTGREAIYKAVNKTYEVDRRLEPKDALRLMSRSTQVIGKILESAAEKQGQSGSRLSWIGRLGQIFWGLVEVAAPNTMLNLLFWHWLKLIYFVEIVLIVGSTLLVKTEIQQFGIIALILTGAVHLTVLFLHDAMRGRHVWRRLLLFFSGSLIALLAVSGALFIYAFFFDANFLWQRVNRWQVYLQQFPRWQKLLPLAPLVILFALVFIWREVEKLSIRFLGLMILLYAAGIVATDFLMRRFVEIIDSSCSGLGAIMAFEFMHKTACIEQMIGEVGSAQRTGMKNALLVDSVAFVPLYWAFFIIMGVLLAQRRAAWTGWKPAWLKGNDARTLKYIWLAGTLKKYIFQDGLNWAGRLAILAGVLATVAAISDLTENYFSYTALNLTFSEIPESMLGIVRTAANVKFISIFISTVILSLIFWRRDGWKTLWSIIGLLLVVTAAIGFYGLLNHQYLGFALKFQIIPVTLMWLAFISLPGKWFTKGY